MCIYKKHRTVVLFYYVFFLLLVTANSEADESSFFGTKRNTASFEKLIGKAEQLHESGDRTSALNLYKQAYKEARIGKDLRDMAYAMESLSSICDQMGKAKRSEELTFKALAIRQKLVCKVDIETAWNEPEQSWFGVISKDTTPHDWQALESILVDVANLEMKRKDFAKECVYRKKVLFIRKIRLGLYTRLTGYSLLAYAKALKNNGDTKSAVIEYKRALAVLRDTDTQYQYGQVEQELGNLYLQLGDKVQGRKYIDAGNKSLSFSNTNDMEDDIEAVDKMKLPPFSQVFKRSKEEVVILPHFGQVVQTVFSPDNKYLAVITSANSGGMYLWRTSDFKCIGGAHTSQLGEGWVSFTSEGHILLTTVEGKIFFYDVDDFSDFGEGKRHGVIKLLKPVMNNNLPYQSNDPYPRLYSYGASSSGKVALEETMVAWAFFVNSGSDYKLYFAPLSKLDSFQTLVSSEGVFSSPHFSENGEHLLTINQDEGICIFDASKALTLRKNTDNPVKHFGQKDNSFWLTQFICDDKEIVTADSDGNVNIYNVATGNKLLTFAAHEGTVRGIDFTKDCHTFVTGSNDWTVKIWNRKQKSALASLTSHGAIVRSVAITSDGKYAASGGEDGKLIIWDLEKVQ